MLNFSLFPPQRAFTIRPENKHCRVGYTLYEGFSVLGWPESSFQRGQAVLAHGEVVRAPGCGQFLPTRETHAEPLSL